MGVAAAITILAPASLGEELADLAGRHPAGRAVRVAAGVAILAPASLREELAYLTRGGWLHKRLRQLRLHLLRLLLLLLQLWQHGANQVDERSSEPSCISGSGGRGRSSHGGWRWGDSSRPGRLHMEVAAGVTELTPASPCEELADFRRLRQTCRGEGRWRLRHRKRQRWCSR